MQVAAEGEGVDTILMQMRSWHDSLLQKINNNSSNAALALDTQDAAWD